MHSRTPHHPAPPTRGDRLIGAAATLGTLLVSIASFGLSFHALSALAASAEIPGRLLQAGVPLAVDGLQLTASMLTLTAARMGRPARLAWVVLLATTALSTAGNAIAAPDRPIARLVWAIMPVLLAVGTHLLLERVRLRLEASAVRTPPPTQQPTPAVPVPATEVRALASVPPVAAPQRPAPAKRASAKPAAPAKRAVTEPVDLADLVYRTCDRLAADGQTPTPADWRAVVAAEPRLTGPQGYQRPSTTVPQRIAAWLRAQEAAVAA